jgi:PAS domain S-box-containing protein
MKESLTSTILIVDDEPVMRKAMETLLAEEGYAVASAGDGTEGLAKVAELTPDLVLLDIKMPGLDGFEVCRRLRADPALAEAPVIMITTLADRDSRLRGFEAGADDFVTKPFDEIELLTRVRSITRLNRYRRLLREQTRRRKVEETLHEREEEHRTLFEAMTLGVLYCDADGKIMSANPAAERILGLTLDQMQGKAPLDPRWRMMYRDGLEFPSEMLLAGAALRSGKEFRDVVIGVFNPTYDELRWLSVNVLPLFRPGESKPYRVHTIFGDVTEWVRAEEKIAGRNRELTALNEVSRAIVSTLDLQEILTFIADHTTQLMGMAATSVLLYDQARDDLCFVAGAGLGADFVLGRRLAVGQGIAGWVVQHGEPLLVPDVAQDPRWESGFDKEGGFTTRSILCVPLQVGGRIIGALEAINKAGGFSQDDLRLLSALAGPVATAIENARLFQEVRTNREQLQALSRRLVEVQEAERGHIARELHDETGQALSSLLLSLSLLEQEEGCSEKMKARLGQMEALVDQMLENLHRLAMNLRPATLDHLGLVPALEQYVETFGNQHGIAAQFEVVGIGPDRLTPEVETAIYRIVQEALTNVLRHAQATRVDVLLERRDEMVVAIVEDDGVGFDAEMAMSGSRLGLFGMKERAEMLGGRLAIESAPDAGTTVFVEVPYAHPHPAGR